MPILECPLCGKTVTVAKLQDAHYRPFCSERCKMIDLGRWLDGTYAIPEPLKPHDDPAGSSDGGDES